MRVVMTPHIIARDWFAFLRDLSQDVGVEVPDAQVPFSELAMHCRIAGKTPTRVVVATAVRNGRRVPAWARAEFNDASPVEGLPEELMPPRALSAIQ